MAANVFYNIVQYKLNFPGLSLIEETLTAIRQEAGWVPELNWTLRKRKLCFRQEPNADSSVFTA